MLLWRIYYGDGSTFSNEDGDVSQAPALDVQAIVVRHPRVGRIIVTMAHYYWYEDGEWQGGMDLFGLFDFLMRSGLVKFGRTVSNEEFEAAFQKALNDPDFPPKFGRLPGERSPIP